MELLDGSCRNQEDRKIRDVQMTLSHKSRVRSELNRLERQFKPSGPVQFVLKLLDYWNLGREDAIRLLGIEASDAEYADRILRGEEKLHGREINERIAHLFFIRSYLRSLFRDLETENEWLREGHDLLEGRKPLSLLLEGSLANVLEVRSYVDSIARR